jgi:putative tricarboxylic transport membrane protein
MEEGLRFDGLKARVRPRDILETMASMPRYWVALLRSAAIGCWMGITPGGPTAASFMSYGLAKRFSRNGSRFGTGEPEGIVSPEAADHAAGTSAMLPMLALGIPGSATAAVMMGGLMIWGLNPGPMLFIERPDFVWGLIASMYLGNVVAVVLVLATIPAFASILRIPFAIIGPLIVVICFIGAYTIAGARFDLILAILFGLVGWLFKKLDYPIAPLVLAMVLGDKAEDAFRQSMIMSGGSFSIFWSNLLVTALFVAGLGLLAWPGIAAAFRRLLPAKAREVDLLTE